MKSGFAFVERVCVEDVETEDDADLVVDWVIERLERLASWTRRCVGRRDRCGCDGRLDAHETHSKCRGGSGRRRDRHRRDGSLAVPALRTRRGNGLVRAVGVRGRGEELGRSIGSGQGRAEGICARSLGRSRPTSGRGRRPTSCTGPLASDGASNSASSPRRRRTFPGSEPRHSVRPRGSASYVVLPLLKVYQPIWEYDRAHARPRPVCSHGLWVGHECCVRRADPQLGVLG